MEGMDSPQLPPSRAGDEFDPLSKQDLEFDAYLINALLPASNDFSEAHAQRQRMLDEMHPDELADYITNEPAFYYRAALLGHTYRNDTEEAFQSSRSALLESIDEALQELDLFSAGFDYKETFNGYLDKLFDSYEDMPEWQHLRSSMLELYPCQLMIAADYFSGMQRSSRGAWVLNGMKTPTREEARLREQEECAREVKECLERLSMELPELERLLERKRFGRVEHQRLQTLLEDFDVARWNFAQVALDFVKGQIYESLLAESKNLD